MCRFSRQRRIPRPHTHDWISGAACMQQRFPDPLDPDGVARAIVAIVSDTGHRWPAAPAG
jgi:hypothetical protein